MSDHRCTFRRPVPLPSIIRLAVRWDLGLSYRDVDELLAQRGIDMDHVTVHRWVPRFTPLFVEGPALPARVRRSAGSWTKRADDEFGQVVEVLLAKRRDQAAACRFIAAALTVASTPVEGRGPTRGCSTSCSRSRGTSRCGMRNNLVEAKHSRLKARLRPMRGLKRYRSGRNVRRGLYELGVEAASGVRLAVAFTGLIPAI